jgi:predicted O-methyltransferase YrrM
MSASISEGVTAQVIERLFRASEEGDPKIFSRIRPAQERKSDGESLSFYNEDLAEAYIPVSRAGGKLLYMLVRAQKSQNIVEFGTSFGISTIHLAAAVRDNGGGRVISTELNTNKVKQAKENLAEAGLLDFVKILEGDALQSMRTDDISPSVDLVLLDGWKRMYLPILNLLEPKLAKNAIIVADDTNLFPEQTRSYVNYVRDPANGYTSVELPIEDGLELSVRT